jgi:predicted small secreted protein
MPVTAHNHQGNNIAVTIVKDDNTIQQFEMQQIQGSTIQSLFANRDIPYGCRSTTTTTPSTHAEDNNTEESTSYSVPLAIVGTGIAVTTLIVVTIYVIQKIKSAGSLIDQQENSTIEMTMSALGKIFSHQNDKPLSAIPDQPKTITKQDITSPNLTTMTLSPKITLIDISRACHQLSSTENSAAEPLLGIDDIL